MIIQLLPEPVMLLDAARRVVAANPAAKALFAAPAEGRNLAYALRHPALLDAVDEVIGGAARAETAFCLPVPIPRHFRAQVVAMPRSGTVGGAAVLLVLTDETAVRHAERMRAEFVANVSHELRSPLASVVGIIETLRGPARDDAKARDRFLALMEGEAIRMTRLIDDLLSLSAVEAREHLRPEAPVDLAALLQNLADTFAARGCAITLDLDQELPAVAGDGEELVQVFRNLIDNGIKYGGGGPVEISARAVARIPDLGGSGVAVAVRDHGPGFAPEHIPRLTERFYRTDKARSRSVGGTGLGLAIVKHIVNRHRGRLSIDSSPGGGATFTVYLPLS